MSFQSTALPVVLLVGGYGVLLSLSAMFHHYNLLPNPVSSLSFQLSLLILQPILLGLFAHHPWSRTYGLLAEILFICKAYIVSKTEGLWPSSVIGMHGFKFQLKK